MRLVVDALPSEFGGIATYVNNTLATWLSCYPDDELHVIAGSAWQAPPGVTTYRPRVRKPGQLGRPVAQTLTVPRVAREVGADAVLSTLPSTTVRRAGVPMVVVVYDLRHELRPDQFSRARRVLRRVSYARGYALADAFIAISQRSLDDLHRLHPRTTRAPGYVVHLAADHVDRWVPQHSDQPYAVAFGHHGNKNVDMVLDAWRTLVQRETRGLPVLRMLGLNGARRDALTAQVAEWGIQRHVEFASFLPDHEFTSVMAGASLVVFPSDFEGFGLPVVEAMRLGIPVVVGPEPAVLEVAGGHAAVMADWTAQSLAETVARALERTPADTAAARAHAEAFTWRRVVEQTRQVLAEVSAAVR